MEWAKRGAEVTRSSRRLKRGCWYCGGGATSRAMAGFGKCLSAKCVSARCVSVQCVSARCR